MKHTLQALGIVMLLIIASAPAMAADRANLNIALQSYTPVPAQPGSYATLTIKILNDGNAKAPSAAIEFVDNYPFSMDNEASRRVNIGSLDAHSDYLAEYRVRIDAQALEGQNYLKFRYIEDQTKQNWVEKELPLTLSSAQKTISINAVSVNPESVSPGSKINVELKIKNLATSNLRDVGVKLNLEGAVFGTQYYDIPLAPIGSSVEKRVSLLQSGQTADFDFVLQAYPTAAAAIYKVPVTLTYTDEDGQDYTRTDLISIVVNSQPDIMVTIDSTTLYSDNGKGTVLFSITNKGFSEIKFLTVTLDDTDEYTVKSVSNTLYLGNVDSDDYETAEFTLQMDQHGQGSVELPVTLAFKDALNEEHTMTEKLTLELITTADAGQEKSKTGIIVLVVAVVVVIGFFVYRARKKHKK